MTPSRFCLSPIWFWTRLSICLFIDGVPGATDDMESLYHQTNKMVHEIQGGLSRLERARGDDVHVVENDIQQQIEMIVSNCERLEILVNKEPPTRRANAKLRVDQLKYDCQHLQAAIRSLQHRRYQREEEEKAREALMSRDFTTNDTETTIAMDAALHHNQRLQNSNQHLDEVLYTGTHMLSNIRNQRGLLKDVHRKILDVGNTLGLSNTIMRLIERRTYQDKFILYGGMVLTCIIMFLAWRYLT